MTLFRTFYDTFLEALFPVSSAERELSRLSAEDALNELPAAPSYSGLAVELPHAHSIFAYKDERVRQLVWDVKYKKGRHAIAIGGYALWDWCVKSPFLKGMAGAKRKPGDYESIGSSNETGVLIILPLPITPRRRRERGFNQCELLMNEMERLADSAEIQPHATILFEKDLLIRTHHATRQTLKDRSDRIESTKGIFGVNENGIERLKIELFKDSLVIENISVIIIDDVITTGSTMKEALDTLKKAGFKNVYGLSLAH